VRKLLSNDILAIICRLTFGIIFIYASLDKIASPDQFARVVYNYHIVPSSLINVFALILPMTELIAGICLILGIWYTGARNYLIILMAIFLIAISINMARGVNLECGCFSVSSKAKSFGYELILRDLAMVLPGVILLFSNSRKWMLQKLID
jgi:uncharacterized membrane protein YphA (DoxX/SURF4 family)